MAQAVCGRFAPTPSGRMHLGNVFCALLAWLSAKKQGGSITLRIEDLDKPRCPKGSAELLEDDLHWLGLAWDTGGSNGGKDAPYYQSRRFDIYDAYFTQLQNQGHTYPCFCNRAELHAAQAPHLSDGRVLYPGTCRNLTPEQLYLYQLLGFEPPRFIHMPLLTAADGRRLSKRDRDLDLGCLRQRFTGPQPLLGLLAFLAGLLPVPEPVSAQELLPLFSWDKVPRSNIIVSDELLNPFQL